LQFPKSLGGDVREVSEDVWASALLFDEAEPLFRVEPLHCPHRHDAPFHPVQTALGPLPTAIFRSAPYCHPWAIVLGLRIHSCVLVEVDRHLVPLDAHKERFRDDQRRCKYLMDLPGW
jgi:hypothetical protein